MTPIDNAETRPVMPPTENTPREPALSTRRKKLSRLRTALVSLPLLLPAACSSVSPTTPAPSQPIRADGSYPIPTLITSPEPTHAPSTPGISVEIPTAKPTESPTQSVSIQDSPSPSLLDNISIMQQEIEKLGIKPSDTERRMWGELSNKIANLPTDDQHAEESASQALNMVLDAMGKSKNPYFVDAYSSIKKLQDKNILSVTTAELGQSATGSAGVYLNKGKLQYYINFEPKQFLKWSIFENMIIVHELTHIKEFTRYFKTLGNISNEERVKKFLELAGTVNGRIQLESEAYGVQAKSYLYYVGQTGNMAPNDFEEVVDAARLIKCDFDPKSQCWITYFPPTDTRVRGY